MSTSSATVEDIPLEDIPIEDIPTVFHRCDEDKISRMVNAVRENGITIKFIERRLTHYMSLSIKLYMPNPETEEEEPIEIGHFTMDGELVPPRPYIFDTGKNISLSIYLEDGEEPPRPNIRGLGLSQLMVGLLLDKCNKLYPELRGDQILSIDGDGSGGFWEIVGLKEGRYGYMTDRQTNLKVESVGMESHITVTDFSQWALCHPLGTGVGPVSKNNPTDFSGPKKGGKMRSRKNKKSKKSKSNKKSKKSKKNKKNKKSKKNKKNKKSKSNKKSKKHKRI